MSGAVFDQASAERIAKAVRAVEAGRLFTHPKSTLDPRGPQDVRVRLDAKRTVRDGVGFVTEYQWTEVRRNENGTYEAVEDGRTSERNGNKWAISAMNITEGASPAIRRVGLVIPDAVEDRPIVTIRAFVDADAKRDRVPMFSLETSPIFLAWVHLPAVPIPRTERQWFYPFQEVRPVRGPGLTLSGVLSPFGYEPVIGGRDSGESTSGNPMQYPAQNSLENPGGPGGARRNAGLDFGSPPLSASGFDIQPLRQFCPVLILESYDANGLPAYVITQTLDLGGPCNPTGATESVDLPNRDRVIVSDPNIRAGDGLSLSRVSSESDYTASALLGPGLKSNGRGRTVPDVDASTITVDGDGKIALLPGSGLTDLLDSLGVPRVLHQTGEEVRVTNSAAETTLFDISIPAGLLATNRKLRVYMGGWWLNDRSSNAQLRWRLYFGGTLWIDTVALSEADANEPRPWDMWATVQNLNSASSQMFLLHNFMAQEMTSAAVTPIGMGRIWTEEQSGIVMDDDAGVTSGPYGHGTAGPGNIDTTAAVDFKMTVEMKDGTTPTQDFACRSICVEVV